MSADTPQMRPLEVRMADALRILAMDAVERAQSGHQGMPMGMADAATALFTRHLKFDPKDPAWPDRDRFVLSAGHGSMLIYALLHLTGYPAMTIEEIKNFRQLGSATPGHPEFGHTAGVETTTGPLGQGIATAVGMAIGERHLNAIFGDRLVDHFTYVIASDGDLMEGVSHEAAALAGHLKLARLIVLFDDNGISIDGPTSLAESTNVPARFAAYGWRTEEIDGHDAAAVDAAITRAKAADRPSLIACKTKIGFGSPSKAGTAAIHGFALKGKDNEAVRAALGWPHAPFEIPPDIKAAWAAAGARGAPQRAAWTERLRASDKAGAFMGRLDQAKPVPDALAGALAAHKKRLSETPEPMATRRASELALEVVNECLPDTMGGSADLTGSNNTRTKGLGVLTGADYSGRFIHYGVREHGMAAVMNGLALHGGIIPYSGTFLVFSDYARPAIRLAALMGLKVVHVLTHDSIGLGEDGPTHQPVEHLAALRAIPNLTVLRPADAVETAECWQIALGRADGPSVLALSRQNLPLLRKRHADANLSAGGAYILEEASSPPRVVLIATGSETEIAAAARARLEAAGTPTRLVSMPCREIFLARPAHERAGIVPPGTVVIVIEAGIAQGWEGLIGTEGAFIGMTGFGASAPYQKLYEHFGITADAIVAAAEARLTAKGVK